MFASIGRKLRQMNMSIFTKLALAFLLFLLPVYILALQMNNWGAATVRQQVSDSFQERLHHHLQMLALDVDRVVRFQNEHVNDFDLQRLSLGETGLSSYEIGYAIKRFQSKLQLILQSGRYVANVKAYLFPLNRVITTGEVESPVPPLEGSYAQYPSRSANSPLVPDGGRLFVRVLHPLYPVSAGSRPLFMLETEISGQQIREFLRSVTSLYEGSGAALVHDGGWEIDHQANADIIRELTAQNERGGPVAAVAGTTGQETTQETTGERVVTVDGSRHLAVYVYERETGLTLIVHVPEDAVLGPLRKFRTYMWILSCVSVAMILSFSSWVFRVLHRPLRQLVRAFQKVEEGQLAISIRYKGRDEFQYLYGQFNRMTNRLQTLVYEVYEQSLRTKQAELKQLQSQINPHFLYNSMFLLYRMMKADDMEHALRLSKYMGEYFQYITRKTEDDVQFRQEWAHVIRYAEIQALRFSSRVSLTYPQQLPPEAEHVPVPQLILQPLVENAFEHAFERTLAEGRLMLAVSVRDGDLIVDVTDNGPGLTESELASLRRQLDNAEEPTAVSGLVNVHRRLQLRYGARAGLLIERNEPTGLRLSLIIPAAPKGTSPDGQQLQT